ncbi:MAG: acyl-CoA synthetase, partial [Burkholderiaceae bacterium]
LLPGATATEAELLAFTAERVDEAPAKPRSVTLLEHMPVTNVGKIYKPELRTLATGAVVQALVNQVCDALGRPVQARPEVQAAGDAQVRLLLDARRQGDALAAIEAKLLPLIAALPVKVAVDRT